MATTNIQQARIPTNFEIPVFNNSGTDIAANVVLSLDGANLMSNSLTSQAGICVVPAPTGANPAVALGVSVEIIPNGQSGRMAGPGQVGLAVCDGAVTGGTVVDASAAVAGKIKAHTAAKNQFGIALTTGADLDTIPVLISPAANA